MLSNADIRYAARERLSGNWGMAVLVGFLYMAIGTAVGAIPGVGYVAPLIITGPLMFGFYAYFLYLIRGEQPEIGAMFSGFQKFGPTLVLYLLQTLFVLLWMLLLIVPGIIAAFRYSMAFFILHDNPGMSAMDALRQSSEMMKGHKGKLFVLYLSFIGWGLLAIITFGIGFLWLLPYMTASLAAFYEQLKTPQYIPNDTISA
ncbi:DUF975 family protein [Paenibacillus sp. TRM 82003]|nr:DUF975 family protein [Paenibacillus sp. TRM 82003]